jgi:hypothetical protein
LLHAYPSADKPRTLEHFSEARAGYKNFVQSGKRRKNAADSAIPTAFSANSSRAARQSGQTGSDFADEFGVHLFRRAVR